MKTVKITRVLSIGVIFMGVVHVIATFTPLIDGKLKPLEQGMHQAAIYFSLMCGMLLVLGGSVISMLANNVKEYPNLRRLRILASIILAIDGILAAYFMPHNPSAWIVLVLTLPTFLMNFKHQ